MTTVPQWLVDELASVSDDRLMTSLEAHPELSNLRPGCRLQLVRQVLNRRREKLVESKRQLLAGAIGQFDRCSVGYVGGGDFIVHVYGIDPEIDTVLDQIEGKDDGNVLR